MRQFFTISFCFFISISSFAAEKIVKTNDGHRVICKTAANVQELSKSKAVRVQFSQNLQVVEVELLKCTESGWTRDTSPRIERVDEPLIVSYPIYQVFFNYSFYIMKENKVIQQQVLDQLLETGYQTVRLTNWEPRSEIFIGTLMQTQDDKGNIIDEKHEDSFGSFNIFQSQKTVP